MKIKFGNKKTGIKEWSELTKFEREVIHQALNTGLLIALLILCSMYLIIGGGVFRW
ncbi:MAG: hypothetical protein SVY15_04060 [Halobacteriota archaeon]|nr:hypothetical protein [Halobacteriota archaeon]